MSNNTERPSELLKQKAVDAAKIIIKEAFGDNYTTIKQQYSETQESLNNLKETYEPVIKVISEMASKSETVREKTEKIGSAVSVVQEKIETLQVKQNNMDVGIHEVKGQGSEIIKKAIIIEEKLSNTEGTLKKVIDNQTSLHTKIDGTINTNEEIVKEIKNTNSKLTTARYSIGNLLLSQEKAIKEVEAIKELGNDVVGEINKILIKVEDIDNDQKSTQLTITDLVKTNKEILKASNFRSILWIVLILNLIIIIMNLLNTIGIY